MVFFYFSLIQNSRIDHIFIHFFTDFVALRANVHRGPNSLQCGPHRLTQSAYGDPFLERSPIASKRAENCPERAANTRLWVEHRQQSPNILRQDLWNGDSQFVITFFRSCKAYGIIRCLHFKFMTDKALYRVLGTVTLHIL